jgi:general L-amino acid transport system permease protein
MTDVMQSPGPLDPPASADNRVSFYNDPRIRGLFFQALAIVILVWLIWGAYSNASTELARQGLVTGFRLWGGESGVPIGFSLIDYQATNSIFRAFAVGLSNTLLVSVIGIVLATILGFIVGLARLSPNWLMSRLAYWYVEFIRNTPLLLILVFLYSFKQLLPEIGEVEPNAYGIYATVKGFYVPKPLFTEGLGWVGYLPLIGIAATLLIRRWARLRQEKTGETFPVFWAGLGLVIGVPLLIYLAFGGTLGFEIANKTRFNLSGGLELQPEFIAVLAGLVLYTASFIAENVRAGITAISKGQSEAAAALGLQRNQAMKLVVVPQAMRIIIPPMTNQYLNLTKNSTLATAIGYPEIINVGNSILQKVPSVEVVAVWMSIFLFLSLVTSFIMNWYNRRIALSER